MYSYEAEKAKIFTEDGQITFLKIRDNAKRLIEIAGAARMQEIIKVAGGDSWVLLACVDRLVEIGELQEIGQKNCWGQDRIFVAPYPNKLQTRTTNG